jgi:hypothetical protein
MKNLTIILICLCPFFAIGQETNIPARIFEIERYRNSIDATENDFIEDFVEGSAFYSNSLKKIGEWEAYILHKTKKGPEDNFPTRIKYSFSQSNISQDLKIYYKNGEIIFADLTVIVYKKKRKVGKPVKRQFYFLDDKSYYESESEDKKYNLQFLLEQVAEIRTLTYQ